MRAGRTSERRRPDCVFATIFSLLVLAVFLQGCTAYSTTGGGNQDPRDTTPPTAPGGLTATATSSTQVTLSWTASTDNVGVIGYLIERCSGANCTAFAQIATTTTTSYGDSGLTASTSYTYRVRATDAAGNLSAYSTPFSVTTQAGADTTPPTAPANLQANATSSTQIVVLWSASTDNVGVTGYLIERCAGAGCASFTQIATVGGSILSYSDSGLTASTSYTYRVRATDAAGNLSPYSSTASVATLAAAAISVSVSPTTASVQAGIGTKGFTATVTNDSSGKGVTWSLSGTGCTGAACGTLSAATLTSVTYVAPASMPSPAAVTLTATSIADTTKSASAAIAITAPISVSVSPTSASVNVSLTQQFSATVSNDSQSKGVTWRVNGVPGGNATVGTISATGLYTAPAAIPSGGSVTVTATSVADPTRSASAVVTVIAAIAVSVSPNPATVQVSQSQGFTATISNDAGSLGVSWSLSGAGCSGITCGSLTNITATSVTYTAPAAPPSPPLVTLTAKSNRDNTKSGSAAITVTTTPVISVNVSPATASVQAGIGTKGFTATVTNDVGAKGVTWSLSGTGCAGAACGTLSGVTTSSVAYAAPASVPSPATVLLTATSIADATKSASATITVTAPISVSVSPTSASVNVLLTQQFSATVSNDSSGQGVTWSVNGVNGGNATVGTISTGGLYTAPATIPSGGVSVTATSVADTTRSASAAVTVIASVSVGVSPNSATVQTSQSQGFTATVSNDPGSLGVTWSLSGTGCSGAACGALSSITLTSVTYTAPATLPSSASVTLTATSKRDGSKAGAATITLTAPISVSVSPTSASVQAGIGTKGFTATVTNDSAGKGVTWSLSGSGCSGTACGTLSSVTLTSVTYNAPSSVPSPATVTLTAISIADPTKKGTAAITITAPIGVSVLPTSATLNVTLTQLFTATVTNDSSGQGVTWSVNGVSGGNAAVGTISTGGLYVAPATVPGSSITVTATSVADPTRSGSATVTVIAAVAVSVSPNPASVQQSQSQGFTATVSNDPGSLGVTWSLSGTGCGGAACGTLSSVTTTSVTYTAPGTLPTPASVTLTATSKRDGTKTGIAAITLTPAPISVSVAPATASVGLGATKNFTATVTNDSSGKGVTWSLSGAGCSGATCGALSNITATSVTYTAPATAPTPPTVTLTATSVADGTKSGAATITISTSSISVSVLPRRGGLVVSQTLTFTATLTNDTGNQGVTWSASAGTFSTCSAPCATVTFTAPASAGVITITATSVADTSKTATATIGVTNLGGVATYLNGNSRQGGNLQEYALATSGAMTVNTANFGKLFSCTVDAAIYAQPLWMPGLTIGGVKHNVVFVATQHNTVYAFDADASPCSTLWTASLIDAAHGASGETWATDTDTSCGDLLPEIGVVGTPVIDPVAQTIYLVSKSKKSGTSTFFQRLHALNLTSGAERGTPATIAAQVSGTGVGSSGGKQNFDPLNNNQRPALLLSNGHVIIAWSSHCDNGPYEGWVMSYSASTLAQEGVFNDDPNGINGGTWMSGNGVAADSGGNLYLATGNGTFDANTAGVDYGDAVLKLGAPASNTLPVLDYFRPNSIASPDTGADLDQGSGGVLLLPAVGTSNYMVQAGKDGNVYLLDTTNLGKYNTTKNQVVQKLSGALSGGLWGSPTYWNGSVYIGGQNDPLRAFSYPTAGSALLSSSSTSSTSLAYGYPGPTPSISSNGTSNGIVWALDNRAYCTDGSPSCGAAVLHAYDATNLATELWNSSQSSGDKAGNAVKFTVPTVANGKVYVGTRGSDSTSGGVGELDVYGLKP